MLASQFHGGQDGQGEDGGCGGFGLGVIPVAQGLEGIVYNAEGRYDVLKHTGRYCFKAGDRWQLGLREIRKSSESFNLPIVPLNLNCLLVGPNLTRRLEPAGRISSTLSLYHIWIIFGNMLWGMP